MAFGVIDFDGDVIEAVCFGLGFGEEFDVLNFLQCMKVALSHLDIDRYKAFGIALNAFI